MKPTLKITLVLVLGIFLLNGCEKDNPRPNPMLNLITPDEYDGEQLLIPYGVPIEIVLNCEWNKTDYLTAINIFKNDELYKEVKIEPLCESKIYAWEFMKSEDVQEKWTFELVDHSGQKSRKDVIIKKETTRKVPSIKFIKGDNYVQHDQILPVGTVYRIGLKYMWDGTDVLGSMSIYKNGSIVFTSNHESRRISKDDISFYKTDEYEENLVFEITDSNGDINTKSLKLIKAPTK